MAAPGRCLVLSASRFDMRARLAWRRVGGRSVPTVASRGHVVNRPRSDDSYPVRGLPMPGPPAAGHGRDVDVVVARLTVPLPKT
jgi:hypothetical protein